MKRDWIVLCLAALIAALVLTTCIMRGCVPGRYPTQPRSIPPIGR